ncbi:hypothetical protein SBADM41S_09580 [Streptomyces badius]
MPGPEGCLQEGPCSVGDLAEAVSMEASACSHQLRLLRNLGLVTGERHGRSVIYSLYDNHVAELLEQALFHVEHLRLGLHDRSGCRRLLSAGRWDAAPGPGEQGHRDLVPTVDAEHAFDVAGRPSALRLRDQG